MHSIFYTISVREKFVLLLRDPHEWRIGALTKAGKLNLWSNKVELFLDQEDRAKILEYLQAGKNSSVGTVEIILVPIDKEISLRAGGHDQSESEQDIDPDHWTEFATWNASKGIKFNKRAPPVLRKDGDALAEVAKELTAGSGVFHHNTPGDQSIFSGKKLTEL